MKNKLLFFLFYVLISHFLVAQTVSITTDSQGRMITNFSSKSINRRGGISSTNYTILGSPFLGGSIWHLGTITLDNLTVIPSTLSYDLTTGILYTIDSVENKQLEIKPNYFTFEGAEFVRFKTHFLGFTNIEYGNLIYDGNIKLLVKLRKSVGRPNNFHNPGSGEDGTYLDNNEYYLQRQEGKFERITLNSGSILAKLMDKKNEISEFLRNSKINIKDERDLILILKFYDGLGDNK